MNKLMYKPIGMAGGVLAGVVAGAVVKQIWRVAAGQDHAPKATDRDYGLTVVLAAAALQGAVFGLVKAAVDRGSATAVHQLTGTWPD